MAFYSGLLGSDGARFPGQDAVDIFLANPTINQIRLRQRVYCWSQGESLAFYERTVDGGTNWTIVPALLWRIRWVNLGFTHPFHPQIAPNIPVIIVGVQAPFVKVIAGIAVAGYRLQWYYKTEIEQFQVLPGYHEDGTLVRTQIPLYYHEHHPRTGHTTHDTPKFKPGGKMHAFLKLQYNTQVNSFQAAISSKEG
ncbi:hypothetical protein BT96DRAFT_1003937 [Gymnopus androsaceus JB14]|uniref:Uncharacterized protein n=1 Tax=Gymnopus androsaceus JB14 TaxID=1447944 RepID=A0A6A4GSJ6_9AGAR|nr:hypothetical protein BT96DRAFT_1003937 [Gymnopus androsaceus JB14]